ncbi:MAG: CotH kinase family protein [Saprospiraceae bacterium]
MRLQFMLLVSFFFQTQIESQVTVMVNLDMTQVIDFDPSIDAVYMSGSVIDLSHGFGSSAVWPMPGTDHLLKLTDPDGNNVYALTIQNVISSQYAFKFFIVRNDIPSWDYGEWDGGSNRSLEVSTSDISLNLDFGNMNMTSTDYLVINEFMATNSLFQDTDDDYEDWLEIYNPTTDPIALNGYSLSDDKKDVGKWVFSSMTLFPGQYLIIWLSGKDRISMPVHTNFKLNYEKESVYLFNPMGNLVDSLPIVPQDAGISYGRYMDGQPLWKYFNYPTPGAKNSTNGYDFLLKPIIPSMVDGYYTVPIELSFTSLDNGATIRYTTDGSDPDINAKVYESPLNLTDRKGVPNIISLIPTNNDPNTGPPLYEGWQPPLGEVSKIHSIKVRPFHPDAPPGPISTFTYKINDQGSDQFTLPVISLNTDPDNLFDPESGIYVEGNHENFFEDWEKPAHITFFEQDGTLAFKDKIAIQLNGNTTRSRPRKSIRVMYKDHIGKSWLDYRLFPDKTTDNYKQFILRNSGNDWDFAVFRDALFQSLAKGLHVETQYYRPVITFINGEYWGIHNIRDKYNDHYLEGKYGFGSEDICIGSDRSNFRWGNSAGLTHYKAMYDFILKNDMSNPVNFGQVMNMIDLESFTDFQITNIFVKNTDWPGNNTLYWRYMQDFNPDAGMKDGRWRWMILDTDFGFNLPFQYVPGLSDGPNHNTLSMALASNGPSWPNPSWSTLILRKLIANQEFKHHFVNRFCDLLNTRFSVENVQAYIDSFATVLKPEISEHAARWRRPENIDVWMDNVEALTSFASLRPAAQFDHIQSTLNTNNLYTITVDVTAPEHGYIKINTIDIHSSTMGVSDQPYPWTGKYFSSVPIQIEAISLPGFTFSHWSGIHSGTDPKITIQLNANSTLTAHFVISNAQQLMHFWYFNTDIPNDEPLTAITPSFTISQADLLYTSSLNGYPFDDGHVLFRKASMERRNAPTEINYSSEGNHNLPYSADDMRGIQIKQPFKADLENRIQINFSSLGYENIKFSFAAKDEDAVEAISISLNINGEWKAISPSLMVSSEFTLHTVDFSNQDAINNQENASIRMDFITNNPTADLGNRITFNNLSITGQAIHSGIDDDDIKILLSPNPTSQFAFISGINWDEVLSIQIFNMEGQLLHTYPDVHTGIFVGDLPSGIYIVKIDAKKERVFYSKLVKH